MTTEATVVPHPVATSSCISSLFTGLFRLGARLPGAALLAATYQAYGKPAVELAKPRVAGTAERAHVALAGVLPSAPYQLPSASSILESLPHPPRLAKVVPAAAATTRGWVEPLREPVASRCLAACAAARRLLVHCVAALLAVVCAPWAFVSSRVLPLLPSVRRCSASAKPAAVEVSSAHAHAPAPDSDSDYGSRTAAETEGSRTPVKTGAPCCVVSSCIHSAVSCVRNVLLHVATFLCGVKALFAKLVSRVSGLAQRSLEIAIELLNGVHTKLARARAFVISKLQVRPTIASVTTTLAATAASATPTHAVTKVTVETKSACTKFHAKLHSTASRMISGLLVRIHQTKLFRYLMRYRRMFLLAKWLHLVESKPLGVFLPETPTEIPVDNSKKEILPEDHNDDHDAHNDHDASASSDEDAPSHKSAFEDVHDQEPVDTSAEETADHDQNTTNNSAETGEGLENKQSQQLEDDKVDS
ncbi:hypothetical protein Pelo_15865 [Pelomyxa schiedti]|nr:hypothetical protein Pelo_15865 [Pelomyxa schiedti]